MNSECQELKERKQSIKDLLNKNGKYLEKMKEIRSRRNIGEKE